MEPLVRVPVIAEVSGIIAVVHIEEGDRVERGQPLFELDRERLEARVNQRAAELALRHANARYDLVGRAKLERDQSRREYRRIRDLHEREVASDQQLERAQQTQQLADIDVNDAHAELAARAAAVAQARELLRQAERDLENAVVRAPIEGVVIEREGEIGRAVADVSGYGGTVIAVIADDRRIRLVGEVDENEIAGVRVGQDAVVSIDAFPDEKFAGRVHKISAAGTSVGNVSSFEVEIQLDPDARLRVGMSADARVIVREYRDALLVPNKALLRRNGETLVRIADVGGGDGYTFTPIHTGYSDGFRTLVREGLSDDDVVLVRSDGERS
jgi:HlyD family secretion protein